MRPETQTAAPLNPRLVTIAPIGQLFVWISATSRPGAQFRENGVRTARTRRFYCVAARTGGRNAKLFGAKIGDPGTITLASNCRGKFSQRRSVIRHAGADSCNAAALRAPAIPEENTRESAIGSSPFIGHGSNKAHQSMKSNYSARAK